MQLDRHSRCRILSSYLGRTFWLSIPESLWLTFQKEFPTFIDTYVYDKRSEYLRQIGAYFLIAFGYKRFRRLFSHEFVDLYTKKLEPGEDVETFYDVSTSFLIIYHMRETMPNKQLENMICHTLSQRRLEGLVTLVLTEIPLLRVALLINKPAEFAHLPITPNLEML